MKRLLFLALLLSPLCAFASVVAIPSDAKEVLQIKDPYTPQEFFGQLTGFPHTFEFVISESHHVPVSLSIPDTNEAHNDASVIIIKEEKRGVSEIGRTKGKAEAWAKEFDPLFVLTWKDGGTLHATLERGVYRVEVSSPNNDAQYRLQLGDNIQRSYFENLQALFEVRSLVNAPALLAILSPLVYVPLIVFALVAVLLLFISRKKRL